MKSDKYIYYLYYHHWWYIWFIYIFTMSYPLDRPESTDRDPRNDLRDWAEPTRERLDPYLDFPECPLESLDSLESSLLSLEAFLRLDFVDALLDRVDLVDFAESWPPPKPQPFPYLKKWKFEKIYTPEPWYSEPRYSEILYIVNKSQLPLWDFIEILCLDIVNDLI